MKPNLIIVQPAALDSDPVVDCFCETLSETHYVYLVRPITAFRDDSPAGVRFLNFTPDRLPGFGDVDRVILIDSPEVAVRLREIYPAARHYHWNLESAAPETVIQGTFGRDRETELAKAM